MKHCPYCNYSNYDTATVCRKCDNAFVVVSATVYQGETPRPVSGRARSIRSQALSLIVLGLLIRVYWGGYGPWPTIDAPTLVTVRTYAVPLLLGGGALLYLFGWIANWFWV
jgi:hypothetical protein